MQTLPTLLRLLLLPQFGIKKIHQLLEQISLEHLLQYDTEQLQHIGWNAAQIKDWFKPNTERIEKLLTWHQTENQQIITFFDPEYPFLLKQIHTAPPLLFVKGNINSLSTPQIAIVGSRYCSSYGEYCAETISSGLSQAGITITSGLALGIDGFCHQAAVNQQGQTIAVLGCGLNTIYPSRHKKLAQQIIAQGGALISEHMPEIPPIAGNFPRRNRIISGLSFGTVVIEASIKSGSLITARYALEQNREVFAVPGALTNPLTEGCHQLIKQGAWLVEHAKDILDIISPQINAIQPFNHTDPLSSLPQYSFQQKTTIKPDIPPQYQTLYQQLDHSLVKSVDELATTLQLSVEQLLMDILELEMLGVIQSTQGGYIKSI
ncbi:DNA-processing protein DprA [Gallibacterium trehalosifermentans]|uniref:DNA-processing protein DprA n=1 Tax=Gallibacterium trehalosifermentans TaxID=516935 RepID=A0ABV6GZ47_9PAST